MRPAFDHRDAGTDERTWAADDRLGNSSTIELPGTGDHLLVLGAHPDDETLGAGGLIAIAAQRGARIDIIVASDGEASHPNSTTHSEIVLARRRRTEMRAAVNALAPHCDLTYLGLPDGNLQDHKQELVDVVRVRLTDRTTVVTPWRADGHPDHEAVATAARIAVHGGSGTHWQFPIWGWHWATPESQEIPWQHLRQVPLDEASADCKSAALRCFRTQQQGLSGALGDEPVLGPEFLEHFQRPFETFIVEPQGAAGHGSYFDDLYRQADDPWGLAERFYEQRKRELLLACLPRPRFHRVFEPGCATGLLTEVLAGRADEVVAWDVAERAIELSAARLASKANVLVQQGDMSTGWPSGKFDLVVLSEVGYYCNDLDALSRSVVGSLAANAVVVACHWRWPAVDHPHTAEAVHQSIGSVLNSLVSHVEADFLLDVWATDARSVASLTGIVP